MEDAGVLWTDSTSNAICLKPAFVSKIMALFIAPEAHIARQTNSVNSVRSAIISKEM
jgi:hypothetical protein